MCISNIKGRKDNFFYIKVILFLKLQMIYYSLIVYKSLINGFTSCKYLIEFEEIHCLPSAEVLKFKI